MWIRLFLALQLVLRVCESIGFDLVCGSIDCACGSLVRIRVWRIRVCSWALTVENYVGKIDVQNASTEVYIVYKQYIAIEVIPCKSAARHLPT